MPKISIGTLVSGLGYRVIQSATAPGPASADRAAYTSGVIEVAIEIGTEAPALEALMRRYGDTPMSLADACLVRLTELHSDCQVFTLDTDFRRYRRHGRQMIPMLAPD